MIFLSGFISRFLFLLFSVFLGECEMGIRAEDFPYDISRPKKQVILPEELNEVSGLTFRDGLLYMVSDEEGTIFRYDPSAEQMVSSFEMKGKGDFEGIECVGDMLYLLRSDSRLYLTLLSSESNEDVIKVELDIKENRNLEGLGYDPLNSMLLIASKKENLKKDQYRKLYGVPFTSPENKPAELYEFIHGEMKEFLLDNARSTAERLALKAAYWNYSFHPSAVAVQPSTHDLYILSYPNQQLCVLDTAYRLKHLMPLSTVLFPQPEGICFDGSGNLYISSEGRKGKATLLQFSPRE